MAKGRIKYASVDKSPRLQRLARYLLDGQEHSTLAIIHGASICAVTAAVTELRENGFSIHCRRGSANTWYYRLHDTAVAMCDVCGKITGAEASRHLGVHTVDITCSVCRQSEMMLARAAV